MPVARAGRLPPTASVVDAVFDALEQEAPTSGWGLVSAISKARDRFRPMAPPKYVGFGGIEDYQEVEGVGLGMDAESEEAQHNVAMYVAINLLYEVALKIRSSGDYREEKEQALNKLIKQLRRHEHVYVRRMQPGDIDHDHASTYVDFQVNVPRRSQDARQKIHDAVHYLIASDPSNYED